MSEFSPEYIKNVLEKIRVSTKVIQELDDLDIFRDGLLDNAIGPIYDVAYSLLKSICKMNNKDEDSDDIIFAEFTDYLSGRKYENIDEFINWLEEG